MRPLDELTSESILEDDIFIEVMEEMDPIKRARLRVQLEARAKQLGVLQSFRTLMSGYIQADRQMKAAEKESNPICSINNYTNFEGPYDEMYCGGWIADSRGVFSQESGGKEALACYHPILPVERMKNLETGKEQIKIAYKRNNKWNEIIVPKNMVTSARNIVALSDLGVAVTSENARLLVKYLSDVENSNDDYITIQCSTGKLGWHGNSFLPYDNDIVFDGIGSVRQVYDSIGRIGDRDKWFDHVRKLRATGRIEISMMLAASLASVLVHPLNALPFFVDLWGLTGNGKSVAMMLAASVWATPEEHAYIKDYKGTDVGLEVACDVLNHLPLLLDDTSKRDKKIEICFENIVYNLCSGKGKTRSNKDLGLNRESHWKNCILTNGEFPLSSYVSQGGALNRIIEVESDYNIFSSPLETVEVLSRNYGFAGYEFIGIVKQVGIAAIRSIQEEFLKKLSDDDKTQKQALSMSIILTADKLATDYLFMDKRYISINTAKEILANKNEVSDNVRCYNYLLDKVAMNNNRFDASTNCEKWGVLDDGYAIFYGQSFEELCQAGRFSKQSFLSWAKKNGVIALDSKGNPSKQKKINGKNNRCIWLKIDQSIDSDGFEPIDDDVELPFK